MQGIVLISHGGMAEGMMDSAKMFFGELEQVTACSLQPADSPEDFDVRLEAAIAKVNSGEGVIVLADLLGGTPANRSAYKASDDVQIVTGMNLTMFLELLGLRLGGEVQVANLIEAGQNGIVCLNQLLSGGDN